MILDRIDNAKQYKGFGHGVPEARLLILPGPILPSCRTASKRSMASGSLPSFNAIAQTARGSTLGIQLALSRRAVPRPRQRTDRLRAVERQASPRTGIRSGERCGLCLSVGRFAPGFRGDVRRFLPNEIHAPCLAIDDSQPDEEVLKIVMKCLWEE